MQEIQETWVWSLGQEDALSRKWEPIPVYLPGKFHGQRSLKGYRSQQEHKWSNDFWQGCQNHSVRKNLSFQHTVLGKLDIRKKIHRTKVSQHCMRRWFLGYETIEKKYINTLVCASSFWQRAPKLLRTSWVIDTSFPIMRQLLMGSCIASRWGLTTRKCRPPLEFSAPPLSLQEGERGCRLS